jgi:hypothetical protein
MTKQQQNEIIISKLADKLADQPNVQDKLDKVFSEWFQGLAQQGFMQMAQQATPPPGAEQPIEEAPNGP